MSNKELGHQKVKEILDTSTDIELIILLFVNEKFTLGQASKLAKMSQFQFQQLLTSRQISLHYDIAELEADLILCGLKPRRFLSNPKLDSQRHYQSASTRSIS
jgi:predicted HTH domain antitoxin